MGRVTDKQVRILREELAKHGVVEIAAMKADMHRNTARKYLNTPKFPSDLKRPREWRTRTDPFAEDWAAITERLTDAPELEAGPPLNLEVASRSEANDLAFAGAQPDPAAMLG